MTVYDLVNACIVLGGILEFFGLLGGLCFLAYGGVLLHRRYKKK